jgi:hypothetical protein
MCASLILSCVSIFGLVGAQANVVSIVISSSPAGANFVLVDGVTVTTPATFSWTVGSNHTLCARAVVVGTPDIRYVFTGRWSDGGIELHTYNVPNSSQTVTANYTTQYLFAVASSAPEGGHVHCPLGERTSSGGFVTSGDKFSFSTMNGWTDAGSVISLLTAQSPGYVFSSWNTTGLITEKSSYPQVDASGSADFEVDGPGTILANFKTQEPSSLFLDDVWVGIDTNGVVDNVIAGNVTVDGVPYALAGYSWVPGSTHTLQANSPVYQTTMDYPDLNYSMKVRWIFVGWSDGGAQSHSYTAPSSGYFYQGYVDALYSAQYLFTFMQSGLGPSANGTVLTVDGQNFNLSDLPFSKWVDATSLVDYSFTPVFNSAGEQSILSDVSGWPVMGMPYREGGDSPAPGSELWGFGARIGNYNTKVIPEFPLPALMLVIFVAVTLLATVLRKRRVLFSFSE